MDDVPFKSTIDWMVILKLVVAIVALINFWCPYMEKINEWIFEVKDDKIFIKKEDNPEEIVEDFFNTPKIKKKISVKDIKKMYGESYG